MQKIENKLLPKIFTILEPKPPFFGQKASKTFISTWRTTTANESITLPASGVVNLEIDWGDGTVETVTTVNPSHVYAVAGDYVVKIDGTISNWSQADGGDKLKLIEISQWGDLEFTDLAGGFHGCSNCSFIATDVLNLGNVTNMRACFYNTPFNQPINNLDFGNVTNMANCFRDTPFNQPINNLDFGNVTNMGACFYNTPFNQPINNLDFGNVTNMGACFYNTPFNQPINNLDFGNVTNMWVCFRDTPFNQPIDNLDFGNVTNMANCFRNTPFSNENYDLFLAANGATSLQSNVTAHFGTAKYTKTVEHDRLVIDLGWTITDDGLA